MITVNGTIEEIANVVQTISPGYPTDQLSHLPPGECRYIINCTEVRLTVQPEPIYAGTDYSKEEAVYMLRNLETELDCKFCYLLDLCDAAHRCVFGTAANYIEGKSEE